MYTPLYIKTDNSLQKSLITVNKLVNYAKKHNIKALTITDDNMYGVMDFYKLCIANDIKPIIGLEIKYNDLFIVVYAMNEDGYRSLIKLSTIQSERCIIIDDLKLFSNNLLCLIPYESKKVYSELKDIYEYVYLTYRNKDERDSIDGISLYMQEVICLTKKDTEYIKYMDAIREGITVNDIDNNKLDCYLKLDDDLKWDDNPNSNLVYDLCNTKLTFHKKLAEYLGQLL